MSGFDNVSKQSSLSVLEKVKDLYQNEYPAVKYITENTARYIDYLNKKNGSKLSIKEIFETYKDLGKMIENSMELNKGIPAINPYERLHQLQNNTSYRKYLNKIADKYNLAGRMYDDFKTNGDLLICRLSEGQIRNEVNKLVSKNEHLISKLQRALKELQSVDDKPLKLFFARLKYLRYQGNYGVFQSWRGLGSDIASRIGDVEYDLNYVKRTIVEIDKAKKEIESGEVGKIVKPDTEINIDNVIKKDFKIFQDVVQDLKNAKMVAVKENRDAQIEIGKSKGLELSY